MHKTLHPRVRKRLCMALAWASLAMPFHSAWAVITTTGLYLGTRTLTLQVGAAAGVDTVQFTVQGNAAANSQAYAVPVNGNGSAIAQSGSDVPLRVYMQVPAWFSTQTMVTTVTNPASLTCTGGNCAGYSIPFSSIRWTVTSASSGADDLRDGVFNSGAGTQTLLNSSFTTLVGGTADYSSSMRFSYGNTVAYPAGTYSGTVTYTTSMP